MGSIVSTDVETNKRIWPIRRFNQIETEEDFEATGFDYWNPVYYQETFQYPAKEPEKDF